MATLEVIVALKRNVRRSRGSTVKILFISSSKSCKKIKKNEKKHKQNETNDNNVIVKRVTHLLHVIDGKNTHHILEYDTHIHTTGS